MRQWYSDAYTAGFDKGYEKGKKEAQTERKGKWICKHLPASIGSKVFVEVNICSNCGYVVEGNNVSNFCPVCGSDMRGEDDDKSQ